MPGEYFEGGSRLPITMGMMLGSSVTDSLEKIGAKGLFNPKQVRIIDGHTGGSGSHGAGDVRTKMRAFAKEMGIPNESIFDLGRSGIEHVVSADKAWALPGDIFLEAFNDGHTTTLGALGAFAVPLTGGSAPYLATGKTWFRVPESIKIVLNGTLPKGVFGRDVVEYVLRQLGPSVSAGKVLEWTGPAIDDMSLDGRFTICCNALFFGAWTSIMNPDQKVIDYCKQRNPTSFEPVSSDADATYFKVFEFDISNIVPQIVPPPERYHVHDITKYVGTPIDRGFVGSCANGRMEDMRMVAAVLKDRKIHPDVIFNVTPATMDIYKQCAREGLLEIFAEAEVAIQQPACGMCWGANTPLAAGNVCMSTGTCNYPGRMGSKDAQIYLANPAAVAASCVEGKIADPRTYL